MDAQGRVYVCDYMNSRIQVFSPEGKLLKILKTPYPAEILINLKNGDLFVFSWPLGNSYWLKVKKTVFAPSLTRYSGFPSFRKGTSYAVPHLKRYRTNQIRYHYGWGPAPLRRVAVDFHAKEPVLWINEAPFRRGFWQENWSLYRITNRDLKLKRDFMRDLGNEICLAKPSSEGRMRLHVDPKRGQVYLNSGGLGIHSLSPDKLVRIDPGSGRARLIPGTIGATDLTFDINGLAYFRTGGEVARYQPSDSGGWREVPFDYGEERSEIGYRVTQPVLSCLVFPGVYDSHQQYGGIGVKAKGHIAVATPYSGKSRRRSAQPNFNHQTRWEPQVYPGRPSRYVFSIFDKHGQVIHEDAFKGPLIVDGVRIDNDANIFCQVSGLPTVQGKGKLLPGANRVACTLFKAQPNKLKRLAFFFG